MKYFKNAEGLSFHRQQTWSEDLARPLVSDDTRHALRKTPEVHQKLTQFISYLRAVFFLAVYMCVCPCEWHSLY